MTRRRLIASLRRVGPRPVVLTRYVTHHSLRRVAARRLRRTYGSRVTTPSPTVLREWPLDLCRLQELPPPLRQAADLLISEANDVRSGRLNILGSGPTLVGPRVDWHRDFKSGYRWPESFFMDVETTRLDDPSDAKVPWDLSRSHHLLTVARAACLTGGVQYSSEVEHQITSWMESNPPGVGINWVQPMEIALRAVNWVWIVRTLEAEFPISPPLRKRMAASLASHARHIRLNLEGTPYLRSNHYLSNILGLLVLGAVIGGDPDAHRWFAYARRAFEREINTQVLDDGMGFEASVAYHGLALEIFLLARHVAAWHRAPFSPRYDERLRRMLTASRVLRHPDGRVPLFGDADSGRVLPGSFARPPSHDALLDLGAAVYGTQRYVDHVPSPEVAWTLGVGAWTRLAGAPLDTAPLPESLPHGGIYVLQRNGLRAVVRCGDVGQNGNGGHAHNDLGSYELFHRGPVVVDPGNYSYTSDPASRNAFRSTAAHNTIMIDGQEINPLPAELFRLPQLARARVKLWNPGDRPVLVIEHDGYRRLPGKPRHQRSLELAPDGSSLAVTDRIAGSGHHHLECLVHVAPGIEVRQIAPRTFALARGEDAVRLSFSGPAVSVAVRAGWVAPEYGVRESTKVLVATHTCNLPARIEHRFALTGA